MGIGPRDRRNWAGVVALLLALGAPPASGCATETPVAEFVAAGADFEGFRSWDRYEIPDLGTRTAHRPSGAHFVYTNAPIPPWGEPFDVGHILLKTAEEGDVAGWELHGMVKRGRDFNGSGSVGWEWFDLGLESSGRVTILWRGAGSDDDSGGYVAANGDTTPCNDCHGLLPNTDHVFTRGLLGGGD